MIIAGNAEEKSRTSMSKSPARQLPCGWNANSHAWTKVQALRTQLQQNATMEQQTALLEEMFSCIEMDFALCQVSQQHFANHIGYAGRCMSAVAFQAVLVILQH